MIFFLSDPHFSHEAIIHYCNRPFANVAEMNETLIKNWNECVGPHDTIFVLGDLTLSSYNEFFPIAQRLNGIKFLIKGNHDKFSEGQYKKLGFTVFHELKMKLFGKIVRMSHYPYAYPWYKRPFAFKSELRFMEHRPPRIPGELLFHGHSHSKKKRIGNMYHVGVDAWNFRPVSLSELESFISKPVL